MKKISKVAIANAAVKGLAKGKKCRRNSYSSPSYRVDVHISSNDSKKYYNRRKGEK